MRKKPTCLPQRVSSHHFPHGHPTHQELVSSSMSGQTNRELPMQVVLTTLQKPYIYLTRFLVLILGAFTPPPMIEEPVI